MSHIVQMRKNIESMNSMSGFSVIIVCCSNSHLSEYWQNRLESGRGIIVAKDAIVLTVFEDWPGGAGNGLGTLYAFQNARLLALQRHNIDISEKLNDGSISVALYHTAGKGTRLAPLPGSENNNKPGVKLPGIVCLNGKEVPITILESVIKQTGSYAGSRLGRVSVFWGDQIFIPTVDVGYKPTYHADILCSLGPMLTAEDWASKGMDKYGLIASMASGSAAQVEKVSHSTAVELLKDLGDIESVGVSLGSFSVSSYLMAALLVEYDAELKAKEGKLDTDPHFWMPMTLPRSSYIYLMSQKKVAEEVSSVHYDRIANMIQKHNLCNNEEAIAKGITGLFGPCDVGNDIYWWDYGQLKYYHKNALLVNANNEESALMKLFFNIPQGAQDDASKCILSSNIAEQTIKESVICNVKAKSINADNAIIMNCVAKSITAKPGSICYNIISTGDIILQENEVQVGVYNESGEQTIVRSNLDIDGGIYWDKLALDNKLTYGEIYKLNETADQSIIESVVGNLRESYWNDISK